MKVEFFSNFFWKAEKKLNFHIYHLLKLEIDNYNTSDAKGQQSPANRILTRLPNNKESVKIECENVCEVTIVVISFI